jgi:uncharacterized protein YdeI (BOF family)
MVREVGIFNYQKFVASTKSQMEREVDSWKKVSVSGNIIRNCRQNEFIFVELYPN